MTAPCRLRTVHVLSAAALLGLSTMAGAREVRLQGANGDGGDCRELRTQQPEDPASAVTAKPPAHAAARGKTGTAPMARSGGDTSARPRWHSFLPGMFR